MTWLLPMRFFICVITEITQIQVSVSNILQIYTYNFYINSFILSGKRFSFLSMGELYSSLPYFHLLSIVLYFSNILNHASWKVFCPSVFLLINFFYQIFQLCFYCFFNSNCLFYLVGLIHQLSIYWVANVFYKRNKLVIITFSYSNNLLATHFFTELVYKGRQSCV